VVRRLQGHARPAARSASRRCADQRVAVGGGKSCDGMRLGGDEWTDAYIRTSGREHGSAARTRGVAVPTEQLALERFMVGDRARGLSFVSLLIPCHSIFVRGEPGARTAEDWGLVNGGRPPRTWTRRSTPWWRTWKQAPQTTRYAKQPPELLARLRLARDDQPRADWLALSMATEEPEARRREVPGEEK